MFLGTLMKHFTFSFCQKEFYLYYSRLQINEKLTMPEKSYLHILIPIPLYLNGFLLLANVNGIKILIITKKKKKFEIQNLQRTLEIPDIYLIYS